MFYTYDIPKSSKNKNYMLAKSCLNTFLISIYLVTAGLSDIPGLSIASNVESPIVFLKLEKSTGSMKNDLILLEDIAERVRK